MRFWDRVDDPEVALWAGAAIIVLFVVLAAFGLINMDDTQTNQPSTVPATVYQPKEVTPWDG